MIERIRLYWRWFRRWQRKPYESAPLSDEQHVCLNCGESFNGQFCPRCGQSGKAARFTPRNVLANALDVWGAGNRSMPRNIIHLLLRPGYMIADYLNGHRQPYFPPFKMMFILVTTFLFITFATRYVSGYEDNQQASEFDFDTVGKIIDQVLIRIVDDKEIDLPVKDEVINARRKNVVAKFHNTQQWLNNHRAISILIFQVFFAFSAWLFFRKSPRLGKLTLSEQFFVQVFISCQLIIISFLYYYLSLFWVDGGANSVPNSLAIVVYLIDYKQLYGFSWWQTIWRNIKLVIFAYASTSIIALTLIVSLLVLIAYL
ncbi:MAG: DUF3667 domain-containing protein [Muribaculaceae bacterium]|nr:DUF3667 domain-containing protein [Muribaculaceae bacterium]